MIIVLVLFNLLIASKNHFKNRPVIVYHIHCMTLHGGLLVIVILQSKFRGWVIYIYFIIIFLLLNNQRYIVRYCILNYDDNLIFVVFYIKMWCIIVFLANFESVISWYLRHNCLKRSTNYTKFDFQYRYTPTMEVTQLPLHKII